MNSYNILRIITTLSIDGKILAKIMAIFLDFRRAFETIDRDILIQKLYNYGVRNNELNWFKVLSDK